MWDNLLFHLKHAAWAWILASFVMACTQIYNTVFHMNINQV